MTSDFQVIVVSWCGSLSTLAANFGIKPHVLATELRRLTTAPPTKGKLVLKLDSPTTLKTLRHRLRVAEQQANGDSP